jgi:pimeloyl-ACP methyl ester carboxylesterase
LVLAWAQKTGGKVMATFVLVHGAWHGSWCWKRVRTALQARGHDVYTPTLTGLGERAHLLSPHVNLETHVDDVVNLMKWEDLTHVILCGHSYAGAVISGVADRIAERISALVYLDAFVLEDGQSVHDTLPESHRALQLDLAQQVGDGWKVPPIPADVFNVNAADRAWVDSQCTMHPLATFQQPLTLRAGLHAPISTTFILATGFHDSPFPPSYDRARVKGWATATIDCGHDAMLDRPEELTSILSAIAAAEPAAT